MKKRNFSPEKTKLSKIPFSSTECNFHTNHVSQRKKYIQSFSIFHPLLDRLLEIKMAKCYQHGHIRNYQYQTQGPLNVGPNNFKLQAPSIQGSMKIYSLRPKTSGRLGYKPETARPKSTSTIIRSRTSEPRVQRKLQLISKQAVQIEQQQLKPSFFINKLGRKSLDSAKQLVK